MKISIFFPFTSVLPSPPFLSDPNGLPFLLFMSSVLGNDDPELASKIVGIFRF